MKSMISILLGYFCLISLSHAQPQVFTSGIKQVNLIELYTSEGCSSCPPADAWLSHFKADPRLWKEVIPLAFHVDYWDDIGWPDRFAQARFSHRQREYANTVHLSSVYTPGVLLNGKEWRGWYAGKAVPDSDETDTGGTLSLFVDKDSIKATFLPLLKTENVRLNVAILGVDLTTQVERGENRGRLLQHDFVVLGYKQTEMIQIENKLTAITKFPSIVEKTNRKALVVWVDHQDDMRPVQATGGWLEN